MEVFPEVAQSVFVDFDLEASRPAVSHICDEVDRSVESEGCDCRVERGDGAGSEAAEFFEEDDVVHEVAVGVVINVEGHDRRSREVQLSRERDDVVEDAVGSGCRLSEGSLDIGGVQADLVDCGAVVVRLENDQLKMSIATTSLARHELDLVRDTVDEDSGDDLVLPDEVFDFLLVERVSWVGTEASSLNCD